MSRLIAKYNRYTPSCLQGSGGTVNCISTTDNGRLASGGKPPERRNTDNANGPSHRLQRSPTVGPPTWPQVQDAGRSWTTRCDNGFGVGPEGRRGRRWNCVRYTRRLPRILERKPRQRKKFCMLLGYIRCGTSDTSWCRTPHSRKCIAPSSRVHPKS